MSKPRPTDEEIARMHRWFAVELFNRTWSFLDKTEPLSQDERDAMLASALASRLHWGEAGEPKQFAIGDWQVSRVYAVLGNSAEAVRYGEKSLALCEANDLGPFFTGYAHEAVARGMKAAGNSAGSIQALERARALAEQIEEGDDRKMLVADLDAIEAM